MDVRIYHAMSDVERLSRAHDHTTRRIKENRAARDQLAAVVETLRPLPRNVQHGPWPIALGKKAYIPGKLLHTNEVLVDMGGSKAWKTVRRRAMAVSAPDPGAGSGGTRIGLCTGGSAAALPRFRP